MFSMSIAAERKHHLATTLAFIVVFWAIGAVPVAAAHTRFDAVSPLGSALFKVAVILLTAFIYIELTARTATVDHALLVGASWVMLAIVAEVVIASNVHHGWYELIGSPAHPLLRDLVLFTWIGAPALFARHRA